MVNLQSALDWADYCKQTDAAKSSIRQRKVLAKKEYFVVQRVADDVDLKSHRAMSQGWKLSFHMEYITIVCILYKDSVSHRGEGRNLNEAYNDAFKKTLTTHV